VVINSAEQARKSEKRPARTPMSDPRMKVSYLDAFPHNQDPKWTLDETVNRNSGLRRKCNGNFPLKSDFNQPE
jgi:hypothetical protein